MKVSLNKNTSKTLGLGRIAPATLLEKAVVPYLQGGVNLEAPADDDEAFKNAYIPLSWDFLANFLNFAYCVMPDRVESVLEYPLTKPNLRSVAIMFQSEEAWLTRVLKFESGYFFQYLRTLWTMRWSIPYMKVLMTLRSGHTFIHTRAFSPKMFPYWTAFIVPCFISLTSWSARSILVSVT